MVKCPFCHFDNEDGALFCEQCKSDLGDVVPVAAVPVAAEIIETVPVAAHGMPVVEAILAEPVAAAVEALPVETYAPIPLAEAIPLAAVAVDAPAMELMPAATAVPVVPVVPVVAAPPTMQASAVPPAPPTMTAGAVAAATHAAAPTAPAAPLAADAQPRLVVLRGLKRNVEYPIYEGHNFIGRADEKPVDIDLDDQEPPDRVWSSRQHALITYESGVLVIEDLNSSNGTFVNRTRIYPGQKRDLAVGDVVQIGTVQMKLVV